jgi:polysaccharide biosynthesis protein PslF
MLEESARRLDPLSSRSLTLSAPLVSFRSSARVRPGLRVGLLSTYPPKICGLGTFAVALEGALTALDARVSVVRVESASDPVTVAPPGVMTLTNGQPRSVANAVTWLSRNDVAIIQHEYGIFGGPDGDEVLEVLEQIAVPSIVVLHTVPKTPTARQRSVLVAVADRADHVVVMSATAYSRLVDDYGVGAHRVSVIPHGAVGITTDGAFRPASASGAPSMMTWGLLGPGKGIEHVIDALANVRTLLPTPHYTVAGVTHPNVLAQDGDQYRSMLMQRALSLGVRDLITFDGTYRNTKSLHELIATAGVVILPYDSREQVTSGVLVDAIAAGRPVIATAFPHAVELLSSGAGIVVDHGDIDAMTKAIRSVLRDPDRLAEMSAEARRLAPSLLWSSVAAKYLDLARLLLLSAQPVAI